jgi:formimidoylglutamate deiminase
MTDFHCPWLLTASGWQSDRVVSVDEYGQIRAISSGPAPPDVCRLQGPVLPGMVNVHSHAHQRLIAGLTGRRSQREDSFWSWRELMYGAISQLSPEALATVSAWLYAELLEGGYTGIGEFHYPHRLDGCDPIETSLALLHGAHQAGCALTLLPVWYRYSGFGRQTAGARQQAFVLDDVAYRELVGTLLGDQRFTGLHRIGMAPHSLRAVEVSDLNDLVKDIPQVPVHIHIAEQTAEVEACLAAHGRRPIELLDEHVDLNDRWCLIHATHASSAELAILAQTGVTTGLCPSTEADLGDGIFPASDLLARGGQFGIGSDSNLVTSAAAELRLLEWTQRLRSHRRNVLTDDKVGHVGRFLWAHSSRVGAHALAQPAGIIEPGRRADFIVLNSGHPLLQRLPPDVCLDTFIMAEQAGMIDAVYVAGQQRVADGRHLQRDDLQAGFVDIRARLRLTAN